MVFKYAIQKCIFSPIFFAAILFHYSSLFICILYVDWPIYLIVGVYVKKIDSINAMVFLYYLRGCINDGVIVVRATVLVIACINNNNNNINNWFFCI